MHSLINTPGSFSPCQLVRLLLRNCLATESDIHYKTDLLAGYKPMAVVSLQRTSHTHWQVTLHQDALGGALGVMPRYLWDDVLRLWLEQGQGAGIAFLEIFNQRSHQLSYRVEYKYDFAQLAENAECQYHQSLGSLYQYLSAMTGTTGMRSLKSTHLFQYGALLGMHITNPDALSDILEDYFGWQFRVIPSDQGYEPLSRHSLTSVGYGGMNQQLGRDVLIGRSATVPFAHLDIRMLADKPCALRHIQDQGLFDAILELAKRFVGHQVKVHLQLEIDNDYLPPLQLTEGFQLGLNTYMPLQEEGDRKVILPLKRQMKREI
ncbi:MAG: hypothetical protein B0D91_05290 [Oceanospirillales bacterium LUC14_002_19_P2]|nr:MAG: hypothetical protein B0D91_05290 [Oceanospirillales bacterium LUC14_002_19_P2]